MSDQEPMQIAIQAIQTIWTKDSRGGQGAARRSAVPEALSLPLPDRRQATPAPRYFLHQLQSIEWNNFELAALPLRTGTLTDTLPIDQKIGGYFDRDPRNQLSIHPPDSAGIVHVTYWPRRPTYLSYARDHAGVYHPGGQEALALQLGEWGQVRYNWRHHFDDGDWWYDLWVVNVGYFTELHADAFLGESPSKVYSQLSRLR